MFFKFTFVFKKPNHIHLRHMVSPLQVFAPSRDIFPRLSLPAWPSNPNRNKKHALSLPMSWCCWLTYSNYPCLDMIQQLIGNTLLRYFLEVFYFNSAPEGIWNELQMEEKDILQSAKWGVWDSKLLWKFHGLHWVILTHIFNLLICCCHTWCQHKNKHSNVGKHSPHGQVWFQPV